MIKNFDIKGHIRYKKLRKGEVTESGEFFNSLLASFYVALANNKTIFSATTCRLHVGSGSTPVNVGQTGLVSLIATVVPTITDPNATFIENNTKLVAKRVFTATFTAGTIIGNLTELGLSLSGSSTLTDTRALFKDAAGNPTSISVAADETLVIEYSILCTLSAEDQTYSFTANIFGVPTEISVLVRPSVLTTLGGYVDGNPVFYSSGGTFEAMGIAPSGSSFTSSMVLETPPSNGRKYKFTLGSSDVIPSNNVGIINFGGFKHKFTPSIPKALYETLTFSLSHTFTQA